MFRRAVTTLASRAGFPSLSPACLEALAFQQVAKLYSAQPAIKQEYGAEVSNSMQEISIARVMSEKGQPGKHAKLFTVKSHDVVFDAIEKMAGANIGAVVVTKSETTSPPKKDDIMGIITERDYVRKVAVAGKSSKEMKCSSLMTGLREMVTLEPQDSILKAVQLMEEHNIRHLPVFDNGDLLGMLSVKDIIATLVKHRNQEMSSMSEYINVSY